MTWSGRGIGRETAIPLFEKGFNVVICSRTAAEIDSTVKEIKQLMTKTNASAAAAADRVIGIRCDVSNSSEVDRPSYQFNN